VTLPCFPSAFRQCVEFRCKWLMSITDFPPFFFIVVIHMCVCAGVYVCVCVLSW
jgi:hypothetical protein